MGIFCPRNTCLWTSFFQDWQSMQQLFKILRAGHWADHPSSTVAHSEATWSNSPKSQSDSKCGLGDLSLQDNVRKKTVKTNFGVKKNNSMLPSVFCYDSLITAPTKTPSQLRPSTFAPQSTTWPKLHELSKFFPLKQCQPLNSEIKPKASNKILHRSSWSTRLLGLRGRVSGFKWGWYLIAGEVPLSGFRRSKFQDDSQKNLDLNPNPPCRRGRRFP